MIEKCGPVGAIGFRTVPQPQSSTKIQLRTRNRLGILRCYVCRGGFCERRDLNLRQASAMSDAFRIAETTQTRVAPASRTASRVWRLIPPMANHGISTIAAAQRT